jgi:hypothetical protein
VVAEMDATTDHGHCIYCCECAGCAHDRARIVTPSRPRRVPSVVILAVLIAAALALLALVNWLTGRPILWS